MASADGSTKLLIVHVPHMSDIIRLVGARQPGHTDIRLLEHLVWLALQDELADFLARKNSAVADTTCPHVCVSEILSPIHPGSLPLILCCPYRPSSRQIRL